MVTLITAIVATFGIFMIAALDSKAKKQIK
jgi:hypothetical protein